MQKVNTKKVVSMISKEELKQLKESLPRGYYSVICRAVPYSERTVTNFFSGKTYKVEIHEAALDLIVQHRNKIENVSIQHQSVLGHE
jgi:hypothetical protein